LIQHLQYAVNALQQKVAWDILSGVVITFTKPPKILAIIAQGEEKSNEVSEKVTVNSYS